MFMVSSTYIYHIRFFTAECVEAEVGPSSFLV
jgi:hypothetical protein